MSKGILNERGSKDAFKKMHSRALTISPSLAHYRIRHHTKEPSLTRPIILASLLVACSPVPGFATSVYPGCAMPALKAGHHTFYVDPVKGTAAGDGSASKPWRTLSEVIASNKVATKGHNWRTWPKGDTTLLDMNPAAPIKAGDVIMLMTGNHGSVQISNAFNTDFITVMAAPGQKPVLDRLLVGSSSKWLFQGLKIMSQRLPGAASYGAHFSVGASDWLGYTTEVIFENGAVSTTDNASSWTPAQWSSLPYAYGIQASTYTSCVSITNTTVKNVYQGMAIGSEKTLVQGNTISEMYNDGIDLFSGYTIIKGNRIEAGANSPSSTAHADGIQGWSLKKDGVEVVNKDVLIDSNTLIKTGPTSASYMQGIAIFDGRWDNLTVSNNVVVSNAYHGIIVSGASNSKVVNNTVVGSYEKTGTWMMIAHGKDGSSGKNVVVRNNIVPSLILTATGVTEDHNIIGSKGNYPATDKYVPNIMNQFVTLNNTTGTYDLRPKQGSPALQFGTKADAPLYDILGKSRAPTVSAGAYN